jgi:glycosyltransferase involved in cell wall biosynthesis
VRERPGVLSVIIPVYNEERTITELLRRVKAVSLPKQIIIVDDCSTDRTHAILAALSDPDIVLLHHERNRGKGAAIRTGLAHVEGEYVVFQDADLEYDPQDYPRLLAPIVEGRADVVYGSRFRGKPRDMMWGHRLGNKFLTFATNLLYHNSLSDMETCYKCFRTSVIRNLPLRSDRFEIEPEITAKLLKRGIGIHEVPIRYAGRRFHEGKKITWRDGVSSLWTLIKYRVVE